MSSNSTRSGTPVRALVALALAFWVVIVGAEWALAGADVTPAHGPHALSSSHAEPAVITDHPHMSDGSTPSGPESFTQAVLPRVYTALVALGLVLALAAVVSLFRESTFASVRGPPRALPEIESGRVMLTRLCIARC